MDPIAFPQRGGVGRALGSNMRKGSRKERSSKPGPKPAPKGNGKKEQKEKMQAMRERKAQFAERKGAVESQIKTQAAEEKELGKQAHALAKKYKVAPAEWQAEDSSAAGGGSASASRPTSTSRCP